MTRSLSRILRRHRTALQDRLREALGHNLPPDVAAGEAELFFDRFARALAAPSLRPARKVVSRSARRWLGLGLDAFGVARVLAALVLPRGTLAPGSTDPWAHLRSTVGSLLEGVPQPALVIDVGRHVRLVNAAACRLLGAERDAVLDSRFDEWLDAESCEWCERQFAAADRAVGRARFGRVRPGRNRGEELLASTLLFETGGVTAGWFVTLNPEPDQALSDPSMAERLRRETSQKEKFEALLTVSHAVVNTLELNTILATIAKQVRQVIQTDECTVWLYDEREDVLKPEVAEVEEYKEEILSLRLRLGEGITGSIALSGRGEIVNHASRDPRAKQVPGTPEEDDSSLLCVPLFQREKVAGVITLVRFGGRAFTQGDLELATLFAGQCSAAIANARLYAEMKAAYEELRETQAQLVQSAKLNALGEMAGGVAHDFNNILAAILGRTQLLLQTAGDVEVRRALQVIEQAALDGAHTVRRVQEFTRVRQDERFETLDVNQVLMGVLELTRPAWEAGAKRRGILVVVARRLEAERRIAGNPSELREVFTNLVLNAVDAMPAGGQLRIETEDIGDEVRVRIVDSGVGMDEETRQRIFDPFFTTKSVKGTGLGLSVAYGIVARHRGTIEVESKPARGTTFSLRFPVGEAAESSDAPAPIGPLPRFKVLVVDDEEPVLSVLADLLRAMGQEVRTALGGPAGLQACGEQRFDVVFSDLGMPEVNGWDLALAVKSRWPSTIVVLATGWGYQLEEGTAQAHGVDLIMPKPFSIEDVERVLRQLGEPEGRLPQAA